MKATEEAYLRRLQAHGRYQDSITLLPGPSQRGPQTLHGLDTGCVSSFLMDIASGHERIVTIDGERSCSVQYSICSNSGWDTTVHRRVTGEVPGLEWFLSNHVNPSGSESSGLI